TPRLEPHDGLFRLPDCFFAYDLLGVEVQRALSLCSLPGGVYTKLCCRLSVYTRLYRRGHSSGFAPSQGSRLARAFCLVVHAPVEAISSPLAESFEAIASADLVLRLPFPGWRGLLG